jgi:hypothetical protein
MKSVTFISKIKKAQALIAAIAIIVVLALFAVVSASLLGTQTNQTAIGLVESTQALYLANAGLEWYLEQLVNDSDWTDETNQSKSFANGTFNIEVSNITSSSIDIKSIGFVLGPDGRNRERFVTARAKKMPSAFQFALFWGRNTGSTLQLRNNSTINGDFWSRGNSQVQSGSSVTGFAYCPDNQDITGSGSFTKMQVNSPYLEMPQIDEVPYNNIIGSFNSYINNYGTNLDLTQNTNLVLNGNVIGCRNFTTTGNITISGNGYIVAARNVNLHSTNAASGTLTITPSGGNIYILAGRSLTVNSTQSDTNITMNPGVYLYSRAQTATDQLVRIRKYSSTNTNINSAFIIANRRIIVEDGSQVLNSTLYVSDVSDTNNYLQITNSGTLVSGSIISVSGRNPGLIINNNASVSGLIYHWGSTSGYTQLNSANITGSIVASQYNNNRIASSTITYDSASIPAILPAGFDNYITVESNSRDGL